MPMVTGVHVDRTLSNVSVKYSNPNYIADVLAPPVNVMKESDVYFTYGRENFRIPWSLRADKTETREIDYTLSTEPYICFEHGYKGLVSDRERGNADSALRMDIDQTEFLTDCLKLDREYRVASTVLDNTNPEWQPNGLPYNTTHFSNLAQSWDDRSGADPRGDIYFAKFVIWRDSRMQANSAFFPVEVTYRLSQMAEVDELRKYTDPNLVTNSGLPSKLWGLKVYEAQTTYNSSAEGSSTSAFHETFGNNVIIAYINPNNMGLKTLTFCLTLQAHPFETRRWREESRKSDVIEVTHVYTTKIVSAACGYVMTNVIQATTG